MSTASLLRVRATDPAYQRLARAEAEHWAHPPVGSLESLERLQSDGPVDRYQNVRFTSRPGVPWQDTIRRYGAFRRGIVLGTSALALEGRLLETNPALHLTFLDLSEAAVTRRKEVLGSRHPGRVATMTADLNFVELEAGSYDLIVSSASMHHVTNLEHAAYQINRALTPDGHFFLQDYVGEPRFQFCAQKKRIFEYLHDRQAERDGRQPGLVWMDTQDLSPFCGVRSDEVLSVLGRYLEPVHVRTAGSLVVPLLRARAVHGEVPDPPSRPRRIVEAIDTRLRALRGQPARAKAGVPIRFLRELMEIGDVLSDAEFIPPGNAFALYHKRR
jgi:SAM-dependent methyltransferase